MVSVGLLTVAVAVLARALLRGDWSLAYVADYTSRDTPWPYRLSALWAGMAGSLLVWTWILGLWAVAAAMWCQRRLPPLAAGVVAVLAAVIAVLAGLLVWATPPFARLAIPAIDGAGLTPVLRHPAMLYHPLLLYAGQVGLAVPFALAVAARARQVPGDGWLPAARAWMTASLVLLGGAMVAGAHWAYVELGWGGYWAWDPVENAALLPWLCGLAFLHVRRAGLAVATFGLALAGAFLTRSGAAGSVHAFAEAATVGRVLALALLAVAVGWLVLRRIRREPPPARARPARAWAAGVLGVLVAVIAIGTALPVAWRAVTGERLIVTGRYFATVTWPFALAILIGIGLTVRRRIWPALAGLPAAALAWWWLPEPTPLAVVVAGLGAAVVAHLVAERLARRSPGALVAHIGAAVLLVAVGATATGVQRDGVLGPDRTMTVRGYVLRLERIAAIDGEGPGAAVNATIALTRDGRRVGTLEPRALVSSNGQRVSVAGLRSTPLEDLSVTLRAVGPDGQEAVVHVAVTPLAMWVWWGGLLVLVGLATALLGVGRIRLASLAPEEPVDGGGRDGGLGRPSLAPAARGPRSGRRA
ncbi:MAG: cytochrome c biogenesis protein CcsA [Acidimicrobiales bacterium]